MFLSKLGLPADTIAANIRTRLNSEPLEWETMNRQVGGGAWKLGVQVEKEEGGINYRWTTWTVENKMHVPNFDCIITPSGKLVSGIINIFALGVMPLDQAYVNELLTEYEDSEPHWEVIREELHTI